MLELLRRGVKSWVAKALLALLILSFAVWGIGDIFSFRMDSAVASVGDEEVKAEDFADALRRQQVRLVRQTGRAVSYGEMRQAGLDRQVLAGLVRDAATAAELKRLGVAAPDRAVADAVRSNPAFQGPNGEFSDSAYRMLLSQQGFTPQRFEELTRAIVAQEVLTGTVAATGMPPPGVPARIAAHRGERRGVTLLRLLPSMAPEPGEPAEEALDAFLEENEAEFTEPERRYGHYLMVDMNRLAERLTPTEEAVREAYEAGIDRYQTPPRATIEQINFPSLAEATVAAGRIASDEIGFEDLAEEQGLTAADIDIGQVTPDDLPDPIAEAVFALEEPGITAPAELAFGAALVRVTEISQGGAMPFEIAREEIARQLAGDLAYDNAPEIADQVAEMRAAGATLEEIAAEIEEVELGEIHGWALDGTLAGGAEAGPPFRDPAVRDELARALDQEERDFIELSDGSYFLAHIDRIEPAYLPEREVIRDRLVESWKAEQRISALEEMAGRMAQDITADDGPSIAALAAGIDREPVEIDPFTRDATPPELPRGMVGDIFATAPGGTAVARAGDGSVVIAQVTGVEDMEPEALAEAAGDLEQVFSASIRRDTADYFARAVERDLGAQLRPDVIEEVFRTLGAADPMAQ